MTKGKQQMSTPLIPPALAHRNQGLLGEGYTLENGCESDVPVEGGAPGGDGERGIWRLAASGDATSGVSRLPSSPPYVAYYGGPY